MIVPDQLSGVIAAIRSAIFGTGRHGSADRPVQPQDKQEQSSQQGQREPTEGSDERAQPVQRSPVGSVRHLYAGASSRTRWSSLSRSVPRMHSPYSGSPYHNGQVIDKEEFYFFSAMSVLRFVFASIDRGSHCCVFSEYGLTLMTCTISRRSHWATNVVFSNIKSNGLTQNLFFFFTLYMSLSKY